MRIVEINSVNFGSTGSIMHQIAFKALNRGDSIVCCIPNTKANKAHVKSIDKLFGNFILRNISRRIAYWTGLHNLLFINSTISLLLFINKYKPHVVHLHNLHENYLNIPILFRYLSKKKIIVVWTLHDSWSYTGHCAYYCIANCERWKTHCQKCPIHGDYPSCSVDDSYKMYETKKRWFNSLSNLTLVPVSNWLENELKNSFLSKQKLYVIKNGVDLNMFKPYYNNKILMKYGLYGKKYVVGVASFWSKRKGLYDYYNLSPLLEGRVQIALVGLNNDQIKEAKDFNILGIPSTDNVLELAAIYSSAEVVLNLSKEETFGLTTIEGMGCGRPSVVYDCTASPELIGDSKAGIIVEPGNLQQIAKAIFDLMGRPREEVVRICRNRARQLFDKHEMLNKYIELYDEQYRKQFKNVK